VTLRRRLALILLAFVALLLVASVLVTLTVRSRGEQSSQSRRYAVTAESIARLASGYTDQETGVRGFIITGNPTFLEPYNHGVQDVETIRRDIEARHAGEAELRRQLAAVTAAGDAWHAEAEREINVLRTQGKDAAEDLVASGEGKARFDDLRASISALAATVDARYNAAVNADARYRRIQIGLLAATLALALLLLILARRAFRAWITAPLGEISSAAARVAAGDLHASIPRAGPSDVEALGEALEDMRQRLVSEVDRADRARKGVEQSASIVLQLQSVLTATPAEIPDGWTVAAGIEPAEGLVAGDSYDAIRLGRHHFAVLVIDIAGHGAAAALTALRCKEIVRGSLRADGDPSRALAALDELTDDLEEDLFVTGFVAVIDSRSGETAWANAGHPPALLVDGQELVELLPTGPAVGPFPGGWVTREAALLPGSRLVLYTDGVTEARGGAEGFLGEERLSELVLTGPEKASELVAGLLEGAKEHADGRLADDATVLIVCRDELNLGE
jgi:sigma-B regulation protein RsbU (phosphoserine phosphatase)